MGRLIDETDLMNLLYVLDDARHELFYAIKKIPELPTVEAIPKAQYDELKANITMMRLDYEARLKADMVAMLTEIQLEIEELEPLASDSIGFDMCVSMSSDIIQQKINALKGKV